MSKKILAVFCCALLVAPILAVSGFEGKDFSGTWKINLEKSEMGGGRGRGRGPAGPDGGGRGQGGPGGGRRGGMQAPMELVVSQDGNLLELSEGGNQYSLEIGGPAVEVDGRRGAMTVQARWDGDHLVFDRTVERETPRGNMSIKETLVWELSGDGNTLTQNMTAETPRGTQTRKMVFEKQ